MSELNDKAKQALKDMFNVVDTIDVAEIRTKGFTIRSGDKLIKMQVASEETIPIESEIREELKLKLRDKLQEIKNRLNNKVTEMVEMTTRIKLECERKERDLKDQLARSSPMPDIFMKDAKRGISVVKGDGRNEMIWLVNGVYYPQFVDKNQIEPKYAKKLISPVVFMITTNGSKVTGVSTRQPMGLEYFSHYHQSRPDCWGKWSYSRNWKNTNDLIKIAREAEAVLETVNTGSIANGTPSNLPRKSTLLRHLLRKETTTKSRAKLNTDSARMGVEDTIRDESRDVWTV